MTTLKVDIDNQSNAKVLAKFLKTLGYVKSVSVEKHTSSLDEFDWVSPGRPATEKEINALLEEMELDIEEYSTKDVLAHLRKWKKKKSA
jgi:hypothetical protein